MMWGSKQDELQLHAHARHEEMEKPFEAKAAKTSPVSLMQKALALMHKALPSVALAGIAVNGLFFWQEGPLYVSSTAVPLWLSLLLFVRTFFEADPPVLLRLGAAFVSVLLTLAFAFAGAHDTWPWALLVALANVSSSKARTSTQQQQQKRSCCQKCGSTCASVLSLVFLLLLSAGAVVLVGGLVTWSPSDYSNVSTITLGTGEELDIFWHCEGGGQSMSKTPTLMLDADASHGMADFWPLQRELTANGIRSCIFDKPGQGWSSPFRPSQQGLDPTTATALMYSATGEAPPYMLVGWGGGGENTYRYAMNRPDDVESLVFLDVFGDAIDWRAYAAARNMTVDAMMAYRAQDLASRKALFVLFRLVAAPFGLGPLVFSPDPSSYDYPERFTLYKWFYWCAPTWTTQWFTLRAASAAQGGWLQKGFLDYHGIFDHIDSRLTNKPVLQIMSVPPLAANATDVEKAESDFQFADRQFVAGVTKNAHFGFCSLDDCTQGFPLRYPKMVADMILNFSIGDTA